MGLERTTLRRIAGFTNCVIQATPVVILSMFLYPFLFPVESDSDWYWKWLLRSRILKMCYLSWFSGWIKGTYDIVYSAKGDTYSPWHVVSKPLLKPLAIGSCHQVPREGKVLSNWIFAVLEYLNENKECDALDWLLLRELEKGGKENLSSGLLISQLRWLEGFISFFYCKIDVSGCKCLLLMILIQFIYHT